MRNINISGPIRGISVYTSPAPSPAAFSVQYFVPLGSVRARFGWCQFAVRFMLGSGSMTVRFAVRFGSQTVRFEIGSGSLWFLFQSGSCGSVLERFGSWLAGSILVHSVYFVSAR